MTNDEIELPELAAELWKRLANSGVQALVENYARAAVIADRKRRFLMERAQLEAEWSVVKGMLRSDNMTEERVKESPKIEHIAQAAEPVGWFTEDHLTDSSATTYSREVAERWKAKGWPVTPIYTAPPARADVTEEMVERAAIATFHHLAGSTINVTWEYESTGDKKAWRESCRIALEAALGGGDGQ